MIESLSLLATAQIRLDVEAARRKAGRHPLGPIDLGLFDPFGISERKLEGAMLDLNLAHEFSAMVEQAAARFPMDDEKAPLVRQLVDHYGSVDWLSMRGLMCRSFLWNEAQTGGDTSIQQFAEAVGLPENSPARHTIEKLAERSSRVREGMGMYEFPYWAMFAVFTLLNDQQFEQLVSVADDMGLMFAGELADALYAEPLDARMERKARTGGEPSVTYEFVPLPNMDRFRH